MIFACLVGLCRAVSDLFLFTFKSKGIQAYSDYFSFNRNKTKFRLACNQKENSQSEHDIHFDLRGFECRFFWLVVGLCRAVSDSDTGPLMDVLAGTAKRNVLWGFRGG